MLKNTEKEAEGPVTTTAIVLLSKENTTVDNKEAKPKKKIKQWPDNQDELVLYESIYNPLKEILEKGYKLVRKTGENTFDYCGYDLGRQEKKVLPSAGVYFSEKFLDKEKNEHGRSLMDVVMRLLFVLGVEQGRRMSYREQAPVRSLEKTLSLYRERNKSIRYQLYRANAIIKIKEDNALMPANELNSLIQIELEKTRRLRIEDIKKEIKLDPSLSCFKSKVKKKTRLTDLCVLANTLDSEVFKQEDWKEILTESGCSLSEWKSFCIKNKFNKFLE